MAVTRWAVVGAGIIGAAVAREILMRHDSADVTVFDKEDHPAAHQTGHNSGVVHAGLYYEPEIGRASCRERVWISEGARAVKKKGLDRERLELREARRRKRHG